MSEQLSHSMFYQVLFPDLLSAAESDEPANLVLDRVIRFQPSAGLKFQQTSLVIFDFETTGLDPREERIIEIGAQRLVNMEVVDEFSALIKPDITMSPGSIAVTGITEAMLADQPPIQQILPKFLEFIAGSILVAHNADFDMNFLRAACGRLGYQLNWPCFCTLKMARAFLPQLESKSLDALAGHYGLKFEARHRSIGDVKVTASVLRGILASEGKSLQQWQDLANFTVTGG